MLSVADPGKAGGGVNEHSSKFWFQTSITALADLQFGFFIQYLSQQPKWFCLGTHRWYHNQAQNKSGPNQKPSTEDTGVKVDVVIQSVSDDNNNSSDKAGDVD